MFKAEKIKLVAASVDSAQKTQMLVDKLSVSYAVAYGLDAEAVSKITGGFYEKEKNISSQQVFLFARTTLSKLQCIAQVQLAGLSLKMY